MTLCAYERCDAPAVYRWTSHFDGVKTPYATCCEEHALFVANLELVLLAWRTPND